MSKDFTDEAVANDTLLSVHADPHGHLHLSGELDLASAPTLLAALEASIAHGGTIRLDLTELTFMDSTGINAVLRAIHQLGERGRLVMLHPTPAVRRVIEICGLDEMIEITNDPQLARPECHKPAS